MKFNNILKMTIPKPSSRRVLPALKYIFENFEVSVTICDKTMAPIVGFKSKTDENITREIKLQALEHSDWIHSNIIPKGLQTIIDELQAQNRDNKISIILDKSTNK